MKWKNSFHYIVHFQIDYSSGDTGGIEHRTQNRIHRTGSTEQDTQERIERKNTRRSKTICTALNGNHFLIKQWHFSALIVIWDGLGGGGWWV